MTNNAIEKYDWSTHDLEAIEKEFKPLLDAFGKKLNEKPNSAIVKTNKYAGNAKYVPIQYMEALLDKLFMGLWEVVNINHTIDVNSVTVTLDLRVFHPVARIWITRAGIGSVPVEISKDTGKISSKALHKNVPAAKSFAFRNAAQSLGSRFGRNLNRENEITYTEDTNNFNPLQQ